jgi:hypothetical protein
VLEAEDDEGKLGEGQRRGNNRDGKDLERG